MAGSGEDGVNIFTQPILPDIAFFTWLSHGSGLVNILQAEGDFGRVRRSRGENQGIENTKNDVDQFVFDISSWCILIQMQIRTLLHKRMTTSYPRPNKPLVLFQDIWNLRIVMLTEDN